MLSHPMTNRMMVTEAISGLNLDFFDNIYFICLQQHEDKYSFMKGFVAELDDAGLRAKSNIVLLPEQTDSQSETVYTFLSGYDLDGFIFIKDSDGFHILDVMNALRIEPYLTSDSQRVILEGIVKSTELYAISYCSDGGAIN